MATEVRLESMCAIEGRMSDWPVDFSPISLPSTGLPMTFGADTTPGSTTGGNSDSPKKKYQNAVS